MTEPAQHTIKVFSPEGEFLYEFGKRGRGPGEFVSIMGFAIQDTLVYVWDQDMQRMNVFNTKGSFQSLKKMEGLASRIKIFPLENKNLLLYAGGYTKTLQKDR